MKIAISLVIGALLISGGAAFALISELKKHHPDKVTDRSATVRKAAHQRILEIRRAYDALKQPRRG